MPAGTMDSLENNFLIAMPSMGDPNFSRTVTYICEHNDDGAMGLIINRPTQFTAGDLLEQVSGDTLSPDFAGAPIHFGGPVQTDRGFILHDNSGRHWDTTIEVSSEVALTASQDILQALAENQGPNHYLISLGYAGWGPGQLEREISENAWLNGPADASIMWELPAEQRWAAAARLLGVDIHLIGDGAGHA